MLKVLIVGLGSIGRMHLKFLAGLPDVEVAALRTKTGSIKENTEIRDFFSEKDAMEFKPDGVIICNPTSLHVDSALPFLKKGIKVLIEKPLADSIFKGEVLRPYNSNVRVAYCMRFLPLYAFIAELIKNERVFSISFRRSFYLPKWHPYANYRAEYTAKKDLGGGVIRTLSHEIDLMLYWFGKPKSVVGITDKLSHLQIDTDDFAFFTCKMDNGTRVNFHLDFFSPANINNGELFTTNGKYEWNIHDVFFTPYDKASPELVFSSEASIDTMYLHQVKDFIQFIRTGNSLNADLESGIQVLSVINAVD